MTNLGVDAARNAEEQIMLSDTKALHNGKVMEEPHPKTGATALPVAATKGYVKVMTGSKEFNSLIELTISEPPINDDDKDLPPHTSVLQPLHDKDKESSSETGSIPQTHVCGTKSGFRQASTRQRVIFVLLFLRELTTYTAAAVMSPLFPIQAEERGMSTMVSGWVFGIFPLIQFASSPLAGRLIPRLGAKVMLIGGSAVYGVATVLFGCLDFLPASSSPMLFIVSCFVVRVILAVGNAFAVTAVYTISTYTFSENPATALGILETAVGVGMMAGPVVGGALYQMGGFHVPFIVLGVVCLILVPAFAVAIKAEPIASGPTQTISILQLLRIPSLALVAFAVMVSAAFWGALDPTLEPHLEQYHLSIFRISLIFLLMAGVYALSSPLVGFAADKMSDSNPPIILGFLLMAIFYLFLGPSPLFHRSSVLWLDLVSLTVIALGFSLSSVPNIAKMIISAENRGMESSMSLHGAVAGLYNGVYALGDAIGPVLGSLFTDLHGFGMTMSYCSGISLIVALLLCILWIYEHRRIFTCSADRQRTMDK